MKSISSGENHACAVTKLGGVYCWGSTDFGLVENKKDVKFEYDFKQGKNFFYVQTPIEFTFF